MTTISNSIFKEEKQSTRSNPLSALKDRYLDYVVRQENWYVLWYMKVIMVIPSVFMILSISAMSMLMSNYIWFVGVSMVLFFTNVMIHMGGAKAKLFVPMYHITEAIFILIPLVTYFITSW